MAAYSLRAVGADFEADDKGSEYISDNAAKEAAVKAAIAIAADAIASGKKSSIIETEVHLGTQAIGRYLVALSVEELPVGS